MRPPSERPRHPARADPVLLAALGLAGGILLSDASGGDRRLWLALLGSSVAALAFIGWLWWHRPAGPVRSRLAGTMLCLALLVPGLLRGLSLHPESPKPLLARSEVLATVEGTLGTALMPAPRPRPESGALQQSRTSVRLNDLLVDAGQGPAAMDGSVLLLLPGGERFLPRGTRVQATGRARLPAGPRNPGQEDPRIRHRRNGIVFLLLVEHERSLLELEPAGSTSPAACIDRLRASLLRRLRRSLSPPAAALSAALLLGTRSDLDPGLKDAIRDTGTLHLFAISGLHVVLVIGAARALLGLLLAPTLADLLAVLLALLYAALAGAGSPILRAATGCAVFFLGRSLHRRPRVFTSLALAAMLLLLHDPAELFRPGFQLSFAAVAGLLLAEPTRRRRGLLGWALAALAVSICATLATAPLLLHHFGRFALPGPLLTVAVTPLFLASFAVILLHGFGAAALPPLLPLLAPLVEICCSALIQFFGLAAELIGRAAAWPRPSWPLTAGLLLSSGLLLRRRFVPALLALCCVLLLGAPGRSAPGQLEFWVLDVGHGQAVLLRSPGGRALLFDCGSRGQPEIGRRTVLPALDELGVRRIDTLVLSHSDADHLNGAADLIDAGRVDRLVHGRHGPLGYWERAVLESAGRRKTERQAAGRGLVLFDDEGLRVDVLVPDHDRPPASDNDDSLVLRARFAGRSILIPGDIESLGIRDLLRFEPDLRCEILVLPHHGNPQPLLAPLLHQLRPRFVLASRPAPFQTSLVPRLAEREGARLLTTAEGGALVVRIRTDGTIRADTFLELPAQQ